VERARDGNEGLASANRFRPQLVILDVMMPGLDGYAVAQRLRLVPTLKNVSAANAPPAYAPLRLSRYSQAASSSAAGKPATSRQIRPARLCSRR
jgi:two-component system CheB/CheR fusion protein